MHLLDLLLEISESDYTCTQPHDRIYALLALQDRQEACTVPVDYTKSTETLYLETARTLIINTQSLRLLHRRRFGLFNLPSWALDWASQNIDESINDSRMRFSCSKGLRHVFEESHNRCLITRGRSVARVTKIATHRFADYQKEYENGNVRAWLGVHSLIPQVAAELEKLFRHEDNQTEKKRQVNWLLAMIFTCGRFKEEENADFNVGNTENDSDLTEIIKSRGPSFVRSLAKCRGRKVASE
jgi:hypothetical protein